MTSRIIILQGGEDVKKRTNEFLLRTIGELSATKKILVIPWTSDSSDKEAKYRTVYQEYFLDSGFREILFLEKHDSEAVTGEKFNSVDVVYLPGGDTDVLYRELHKRSLQDRLRNFSGILVGNSAGAIVLSRGTMNEGKFYPGFGLVDFFVSVHYRFNAEDIAETSDSIYVNIPENMWITVTGR